MDRIEKIESDLGMQRDRAGKIENNLSVCRTTHPPPF